MKASRADLPRPCSLRLIAFSLIIALGLGLTAGWIKGFALGIEVNDNSARTWCQVQVDEYLRAVGEDRLPCDYKNGFFSCPDPREKGKKLGSTGSVTAARYSTSTR